MPKLYEYLGLIVLFYANEHEPIHVHAKCQGRESKAELVLVDGRLEEILLKDVRGKSPLSAVELGNFRELVEHYADDIVQKWIDFFVLHKSFPPLRIDGRIK